MALVVAAIGGIVAKTFAGDDSAGASGGTGGASSAAANGGGPAAAVTVAIGLDAPLSGSLAAFGLSLKNSAELAVRTANQTRYVPGVTFELKALDDQAQPAKGEQNAGQFVGDNKVLGVVGPLNSSVAQSMLGVLDQAGLVDVSPANTNPVLTQGADWAKGSKSRPYKTYFRTVTTDAAQGPFAAQYLYKEARKTRLFVIDDKKSYGASLAAGFSSEFTRLGGSVVGTEHTNPDDRDFPTLAARVKTSGADAVYYGGDYPAAAALSQQLKQAGANVPLMGGDGIYAPEFISLNPKAEGDLASSVGAPPQELPSAKSFLSQYRAAGYPEDPGSYGGYAYDSVWAVIEAVRSVVAANGGALPVDARARVVKAMAGVAFDGVTGRVAFDEYGDTLNRQLTVSTVRGGSWATVKTGTYTP
ncbi:branched-chain amino acid ABC transporter substrate-binding protein [Kitasatospora sp. NPDC050543]|uniref:branched-chain amino acid ABC transporter substrate-binding protein n=1 Tax=Kitasatospora sp. NPDC050543 TaxID=3364054 RepID=UPI00379823C5